MRPTNPDLRSPPTAGTLLTSGKKADAAGSAYLPGAGHVFVINLENKGYDQTWGPGSAAPYLSTTLCSKGVLLNQYFGTAHNSLPSYISQISGQGPNPQTLGDCQSYSPFVGAHTAPPGQAVGDWCVYPASTQDSQRYHRSRKGPQDVTWGTPAGTCDAVLLHT